MTNIEVRLPEPVLEQAHALAELEGIPLEQIISLAVTQTIAVWSHRSLAAGGARRASPEPPAAVTETPLVPGEGPG